MSRSRREKKIHKQYIEVRESSVQGRGVYCVNKIKRGQRIIEYIGERITPEEEAIRYDDDAMDRHHTFLFHVDENTTIDGAVDGNDARYINHSCDPNCEAVDEEGHIFIEAIRVIHPGEELFYDYGFEHEGEITSELAAKYPCYCGSPKCKGTILRPA